MRRFNHSSEEQIKQALEHLPRVEDKRSKEDIYQNIVRHSSKPRQKPSKKWVVPAFSAAAACLLLLVLVPNLMSLNNQSGSPGGTGDNAEEEADMSTMEDSQTQERSNEEGSSDSGGGATSENAPADEETEDSNSADIEEEPTVETGEKEVSYENYTAALKQEDIGQEENAVTIPLQNAQASLVVPVTFIAEPSQNPMETLEQQSDNYNGEELGLGPSPLRNIDWTDGGDNTFLEADFDEKETPVSSAESNLIVKSLSETLRYRDETEVLLTDDGDSGVDLGSYGMMEHYTEEENNRGYYVYTSDTGRSFLVSQQAADLENSNQNGELLTFDETLEHMQSVPDESNAEPSIPADVSFEAVEEEDGAARVAFAENSEFPEEGNVRWMMESILFTAADFGYDQVVFEGISAEEAGGYPVNQPVDIPIAPNRVPEE
ncbi:hypothetical protein [Salibacterium aidingense]|uniref:hypothetical protein n=1 Tax=Salibacterium aidingense TaxID=384933 RepID=UPI003BC992EE